MGVSRSASFVIGFLISKGFTFYDALLLVQKQRPQVKPLKGFQEQLQIYEKSLRK